MSDSQTAQIEIAERLKLKVLEHLEKKLDDKEINATELASAIRLLSQNGWSLDPTRLPQRLKDKLTETFDPTVVDADDKVIPIRRKA
jgi:predicted DNA-binding ribbon-helix-helix protein